MIVAWWDSDHHRYLTAPFTAALEPPVLHESKNAGAARRKRNCVAVMTFIREAGGSARNGAIVHDDGWPKENDHG